MALRIRPVSGSDFDQWSRLWDGYNAFYGRAGPTALAPEITRTTWARFFDAYEPVHAQVADLDGTLVGLVHYLLHRSTISIEPSVYLQDLFADPDRRGQGVGRALIATVYEWARAAGIWRVYWQTHETNQPAMRLYEQVADRSGFVVYQKKI